MKVIRYFTKFGEGIAEMSNGEYWICCKQVWRDKRKDLESPPLPHGIISQNEWLNLLKFKRS